MKDPAPKPGPPRAPAPPNAPPRRPGPPNPWGRPGTVVVVDVAPDAVTAAALSWGVPLEEVAAWASAVAPTATPAAAPTPTASLSMRLPRAGRGGGDQRISGAGGVTDRSSIAQPLRLPSSSTGGGAVLSVTVRLDPVVKLWITSRSLNESGAEAVLLRHRRHADRGRERTALAMSDKPGSTLSTHAPRRGASSLRMARRILGAAAAVAAVAVGSAMPPASAAGATVDVATGASFGTILTNSQGFALYTFPMDHNGISSCSGSCATVWPALTVPAGTTPTAGSGVPGTVASVLQANGTYQVTYNGSPLYTFVSDSSPGQVSGNGVGGFSVVKVTAAPSTPTTAAPSTPTTAVPSTPTTAAPSTKAPTTPSTVSGSPATTAPAAAPAGGSGGSGPTTGASAPSAASSSAPVSSTSPTSLAFTGPGPGLVWMVVVGAGLIVTSLAVLVMVGERRLARRTARKASRTGSWLLGR